LGWVREKNPEEKREKEKRGREREWGTIFLVCVGEMCQPREVSNPSLLLVASFVENNDVYSIKS
jgi:hypothetical protein